MFVTVFKDSRLRARIRNIRLLAPNLAAADVDWEMTGAKSRDGSSLPDRKGLLNW
jgi:hypothetical protein